MTLGVLIVSACTGTVPTPNHPQIGMKAVPPVVQYFTATPASILTPTFTPSPSPTPTWMPWGPGDVRIPILLFHHIGTSPTDKRYYVPVELFDQELKVLHDWGYKTITIENLVNAITTGRELPEHPILITFDDGNVDNYTSAFPIMKKYGFTGTLYIVGRYMGADGFLSRQQILEMHTAGWDIGSHSLNHYDLAKLGQDDQEKEIFVSKKMLEKELGIKILTFAYPFGTMDKFSINLVQKAGYIAAMGAEGYTDNQGKWNLFNLQRVEFKGTEDTVSFTRFLTWHGSP